MKINKQPKAQMQEAADSVASRSSTCCCSKNLSMMKGRHLEKRGGQVFILKCFTSLRRFCWLQVNFSQATAYPAVRQVGAIVFQKAVAGQLPQMAHSGHCQLRGDRLQWAVSIHQSLGFAAITLLASNQNAMSEHLGSS